MPIEQLTYAQIAERLSVTPEAVRALVRRLHLPRLRGNDGKTLIAIDLAEVRHRPLPARSPRGGQPVTDLVATLKERTQILEAELAAEQAELAAEQQRSAGHRADYEHERERADRMVATQDRLVTELEALHALLEAARPVTPQTWWEMTWRERLRWLRSAG
jgi:hypothetical protein